MDPPFPLAPLAPGRLLGPYRLERPIDQGGMGVVFAARAAGGGREVVIKALRPEFADDADRRARFAREVRALGKVSHPNLLSLLDADPDAPIPWLAVEPIEGQPLAEYLREAEPSIKERVRLLADAASAVAAMHAAGIVHRDLKPSNILIGADGEPVVIDFGLARIDGEDFALTRRDQRVGTPRYMAPEQIDPRIGRIGPRTDVYQLGVVLYFLLAERPPNADRDTTEVYRRVRTGRFSSPRRFRPDTPRVLERIVRKAMARRPADRFASADELAAELGRWVRGEPLRIDRPFWRRWFDRSGTRVDGPAADS